MEEDKYKQLEITDKRLVISEMSKNVPPEIDAMARELTKIKNVGYITAIEILIHIGRYAFKDEK